MEKFDIVENGKPVGRAQVEKNGLYYSFSCRCRGNGVFRIRVSRGGREESLGIPVPRGNEYCLEKKLPASRFPEGQFRFFIGQEQKERFVPVVPGQPFAYLSHLKNARYAVRDGIAGVIVSDVQDDAHGAMVGAENVSVDGSLLDGAGKPV